MTKNCLQGHFFLQVKKIIKNKRKLCFSKIKYNFTFYISANKCLRDKLCTHYELTSKELFNLNFKQVRGIKKFKRIWVLGRV